MIKLFLYIASTGLLLSCFRIFSLGDSYTLFNYSMLLFVLFFISMSCYLIHINKPWLRVFIGVYVFVIFYTIYIKSSLILGYSYDIVSSRSNAPTLNNGDMVVSRHFNISMYRGNYIGFEIDGRVERKKIVGTPDDTVMYCEGAVFVEGVFNPIMKIKTNALPCTKMIRLKLAKDEFFVIGDNFENSKDSRFFGAIKSDDIIAQSIYKIDVNSGEQMMLGN